MLGLALPLVAGADESPIDRCVSCHAEETPAIVKQWEASKHSKSGVKCYVCHMAAEKDPAGAEHHGFHVTATVGIKSCEGCHPAQLESFTKDWASVVATIHGRSKK